MNGRRLLILCGTFLSLALVASALAQDPPNRAALVVSLGDGRTETRCVEFVEAEVSGLDLLERSGLQLDVEFQSGGALVCNIEGKGCPVNDCWCQCSGGPDCIYWSYWQLTDGEWTYSLAGATAYRVQDGAVQGWSWGPGSITEAIPPPATSFDAICQQAAPATNTPVPTSQPVILPTLPPAGGGLAATMTVRPSATSTAAVATATATMAVQTPTSAVFTVESPGGAVTLPAPTGTQPALAGVIAVTRMATETPVAEATSATNASGVEQNPDAAVDLSESIVEPAPAQTPTEPSAATPVLPGDPAAPTTITSIENNLDAAATVVVREVVGQTTAGLAPSNPPTVAEPEDPRAQDVPLARYAVFGALVLLLGALFGLVYLRRARVEADGSGYES